jgi:hypothetical protein
MKNRVYLLLAGLGLAALSAGCSFKGYQVDPSARAFQILGVGWVHDKCGTNDFRAFVLGSLHDISVRAAASTNAPVHFVQRPLGTLLTPP